MNNRNPIVSGKWLWARIGETLLHSKKKPRFRRTQTKYIFAIKARGEVPRSNSQQGESRP
jgi:hypothetical protein